MLFKNPQPMTSEELIARVRLNEREAFNALYQRHYRGCFDYAYRMFFDRRDAEDAVQDAFLRVFMAARRGGYDPAKGRFQTYLYRILRNLCYDRLAVKKPLNATDLHGVDDEEFAFQAVPLRHTAKPEDHVQGNVFRARIVEALQQLPTLQREALTLRGFDGLSYKEIAHVLDRPVAHVKIILFRARQNLARLIDVSALPEPGAGVPLRHHPRFRAAAASGERGMSP